MQGWSLKFRESNLISELHSIIVITTIQIIPRCLNDRNLCEGAPEILGIMPLISEVCTNSVESACRIALSKQELRNHQDIARKARYLEVQET